MFTQIPYEGLRDTRSLELSEWWQQLVLKMYNFQTEHVKFPKKATLTGNIVVVFYTFLVGIATACLIFVAELVSKLGLWVALKFFILYQNVKLLLFYIKRDFK